MFRTRPLKLASSLPAVAVLASLATSSQAVELEFTLLEAAWSDADTESFFTTVLFSEGQGRFSENPSVSWGSGFSFSGYDFEVAPTPLRSSPASLFSLGDFTHRNQPIFSDAITGVDMTIRADVSVVDGASRESIGRRDFRFRFSHEETPNSGPGSSDDIVTVERLPETDTFEALGLDFTLDIDGFAETLADAAAGNFNEEFSSPEGGNNTQTLAAQFTVANAPPRRVQSFGDTRLFGDNAESGAFAFDPSLPSVLVTHGWQPGAGARDNYTGDFGSVEFLDRAYDEINRYHGDDVNVLLFSWEDAFTGPRFPDPPRRLSEPLPFITQVGTKLGRDLAELFDRTAYDQPLHMIGHSYGSAVNISAANEAFIAGYDTEHMTVLDAPTDAPFGVGLSVFNYDFAATSAPWRRFFDNYYGTRDGLTGAYGGPIQGAERDGGYTYLGDRHSQVWETYIDSVAPQSCGAVSNGGFLLSAALGSNGCFDQRPGPVGPVEFNLSVSDAPLLPVALQNGTYDTETSTANISTGSDGFGIFQLSVPDDAEALMFELAFDMIGDGDWLEVQFGDDLLGAFQGTTLGTREQTLIFNFSRYAGTDGLLTLLLASSGPEQAAITASGFRYARASEGLLTPVPLPMSAWFLIAGLGALGITGRRRAR